MDMREQALAYAKRGWGVFPLRPRSKKPLTTNGLNAATTNQLTIERWWDRYPDANIGLRTGSEMKVWVLDVDGSVGSASLTELENELGVLPETLDQQTGGGGRQLLFAWPEGREIRNRSNVRPGIDVRGEGGYIVAPPSIHPSGTPYSWPTGDRGRIAQAPKAWLDLVCPPPAPQSAPWEHVGPLRRPPPLVINTPILKRASLYLSECAPAVQGRGGHNALLWAARALVVGLELSDSEAIGLLWSEFNPRCSPPWRQDVKGDRKEFERKVSEARRTPGEKRRGWLLDELGLRTGQEALRQIARGRDLAQGLLSAAVKRGQANPAEPKMEPEEEEELPEVGDREPFPVNKFPAPVAEFLYQVAESHQVDLSFAALPALAVAGAAMGNAWRLELKKGFRVPPTLWVGLVASSGTNKSGPLREVTAPLHVPVPMDMIGDSMLNPQQEMVVGDATVEAVISHLQENVRGVLVFRDELAGWMNGFNAYKSKGGDEQVWLELWGAGAYAVSRKTNNERTRIPAASACVLGGIQPSILASCFDPAHFASGLVPRILIACPPRRQMFWSEAEVSSGAELSWGGAITWLRSRPFAELDPNASVYRPHVLQLSAEAKAHYVTFFDALSLEMDDTTDDNTLAFMSKARLIAARLALIHHGMVLACANDGIRLEVQAESVQAGAAWARWCLEEQIRVYGFGAQLHRRKQAEALVGAIRQRLPTATASVRQIQRLNQKRFRTAQIALAAMAQLVELRHAQWTDEQHKQITLLGER